MGARGASCFAVAVFARLPTRGAALGARPRRRRSRQRLPRHARVGRRARGRRPRALGDRARAGVAGPTALLRAVRRAARGRSSTTRARSRRSSPSRRLRSRRARPPRRAAGRDRRHARRPRRARRQLGRARRRARDAGARAPAHGELPMIRARVRRAAERSSRGLGADDAAPAAGDDADTAPRIDERRARRTYRPRSTEAVVAAQSQHAWHARRRRRTCAWNALDVHGGGARRCRDDRRIITAGSSAPTWALGAASWRRLGIGPPPPATPVLARGLGAGGRSARDAKVREELTLVDARRRRRRCAARARRRRRPRGTARQSARAACGTASLHTPRERAASPASSAARSSAEPLPRRRAPRRGASTRAARPRRFATSHPPRLLGRRPCRPTNFGEVAAASPARPAFVPDAARGRAGARAASRPGRSPWRRRPRRRRRFRAAVAREAHARARRAGSAASMSARLRRRRARASRSSATTRVGRAPRTPRPAASRAARACASAARRKGDEDARKRARSFARGDRGRRRRHAIAAAAAAAAAAAGARRPQASTDIDREATRSAHRAKPPSPLYTVMVCISSTEPPLSASCDAASCNASASAWRARVGRPSQVGMLARGAERALPPAHIDSSRAPRPRLHPPWRRRAPPGPRSRRRCGDRGGRRRALGLAAARAGGGPARAARLAEWFRARSARAAACLQNVGRARRARARRRRPHVMAVVRRRGRRGGSPPRPDVPRRHRAARAALVCSCTERMLRERPAAARLVVGRRRRRHTAAARARGVGLGGLRRVGLRLLAELRDARAPSTSSRSAGARVGAASGLSARARGQRRGVDGAANGLAAAAAPPRSCPSPSTRASS